MIYSDKLDKDRLYFTQCNDEFSLRCPECAESKALRHCKIFANFPGLWCHLKRDHDDIPEPKFEEIKQVLSAIFKAYQWQVFPKWKHAIHKNNTTSSSLRFDGKTTIRADVWENICQISNRLKIQSELYPVFNLKQLKTIIKVSIGEVDSRTARKYLNCVINASFKDNTKGVIDVRAFCDTVGV